MLRPFRGLSPEKEAPVRPEIQQTLGVAPTAAEGGQVALRCVLPEDAGPALRGCLRAGFHAYDRAGGLVKLLCTREEWERLSAEEP